MALEPKLFLQPENNNPSLLQRLGFGRNGAITENMTLANFLTWLYANLSFRKFKTAASGLPSISGAGDIEMDRANDYYSETAITGNVTWGLLNIVVDGVVSIDVNPGAAFTITLAQSGIAFKGSIAAGIVQNLTASKSNLISIWAQTATVMWVTVLENESA